MPSIEAEMPGARKKIDPRMAGLYQGDAQE
jgi:hypothetical protein